MDHISIFLKTLHDKTAEEYRGIAEKAIERYEESGQLTEKLYKWAITTAKFNKVKIPIDFDEVAPNQPVSQTFVAPVSAPVAPVASLPVVTADDTNEILAAALLQAAGALLTAAEQLKAR